MNTKLLRQKILDLAIRGKLTEQKKSDGTTRDLLKQIAANVILSNAKNPGKSKNAPKEIIPLDKSEAPFEIPENWEWVRLGDVCEIKSSKRVFESDYVESGVPFYRSKEIGDLSRGEEIKTSLFIKKIHFDDLKEKYGVPQAGDVLITSVGTIGNTWICDGRDFYYKDGNITQIRKNLHIESKYIQLFLASPVFFKQALSTAAGTAQAALTIVKLNALLFPLPPLAEQQRIVTAIENAFAEITEIESNRELLKKHIKQGRQKILDLAIRGKLTEQKKSDGTTKALLKQIQDERTGEALQTRDASTCHCEAQKRRGNLKQSKSAFSKEIIPLDKSEAPFEIPENWEWVKLGDICGIVSGGTPKTEIKEFWDNGTIPWLSPADLTGYKDMYISEGAKKITSEGLRHSSAVMMPEKSVLYSSRAPIGYVAIAKNALCTNQGFKSLLPSIALIPEFAYYLLKARTEDIKLRARGTTFKEISGSELGRTLIPLPPLAEQQRIVATIEQAFAEFNSMEKGLQ